MIKDLNVKNLKTIKKNNEEYLVVPIRIKKSKKPHFNYFDKIYLKYYSDIMMVEARNYPEVIKSSNSSLLYFFFNRDVSNLFAPFGIGLCSLFYLKMRNKKAYSRFKAGMFSFIFMFGYSTLINVKLTYPGDKAFKNYIEKDLVGFDEKGVSDKELCEKVENFLKIISYYY